MPDIKIFAADQDPRLPELRKIVTAEMERLGYLPSWKEVSPPDTSITKTPRKNWQAAIFVDGRRAWTGKNLPTPELMARALRKTKRVGRGRRYLVLLRKLLSFFFALFVAFFPKCPFCWAAYLSALGIAGSQSLPYRWWYLPLSICLLLINTYTLYRNRKKTSEAAFVLSLAGAAVIIGNRLYFNQYGFVLAGCCLLFAGAAWNSLTPIMIRSIRNIVSGKIIREN